MPNKTVKILYVEDDFAIQKSIYDVLSAKYGVDNVFTASNGEEAFELYKNESPDIVVTDIKMPKIDGIQLIELIRNKDRNIPIIIVSAYERDVFDLEGKPVCQYLVKPVQKFTLLYAIETCLYGKQDK
jgi:YesN/AraC family two-component response regulator